MIYHVNVNVNLMEENVIQIIGGIVIIVDVSVKKVIYVKKIMFGILLRAVGKMENIQQVLWMIQQLFVMKLYMQKKKKIMEKFNITCKTQNFYILFAFLLIVITLLIAVSIYCYLIKYRTKHLLPFHDIKN